MRKTFTLFLTMILVVLTLGSQTMSAQTVLLQEGFDEGMLPAGWTIVDADGDGYGWDATFLYQHNPSAAQNGDGFIASASYLNDVGALSPDNWLVSPAINIPSGLTELTFWVKGQAANYAAENYSVYVASSNMVSSFAATVPVLTGTTTSYWEQKTVDLSAFAGQTVYIAFRHHNTTDMYWLDMDEVEVKAYFGQIISVNPDMLDFGYVPLSQERIKTIAIKGYNLSTPIVSTAVTPFSVSSDSVNYGATAVLNAIGGVLYVKFAPVVADSLTEVLLLSSDTLSKIVAVTGNGVDCSLSRPLPYLEDFNTIPPICWNIISQQDETWKYFYYDSQTWATCVGGEDNKTEQLETCVFDFSQDAHPLLKFYFMSNYNYVSNGSVDFKIYVSTDGGNTYLSNPVWKLSQFGYFDAWTSTMAKVDLTSLAGQSAVKFKFSYEGALCQVLFGNMEMRNVLISPEKIVYVKQNASGTGDGSSWDNAMDDIQNAINLASLLDSTQVWAAGGIYNGDTTAVNAFTMVEGVNVYGGFTGVEPANFDLSQRNFETNATVLDGQNARRVLYQPSAFSIQTVWDGFTIQNGYTTGSGGGAYLYGNGKLNHCVIKNNASDGYAGGVYANYNSIVTNSKITNNSSSYYGGGVYARNATVSHCQICNNTSNYGGGVYAYYNSLVTNSLISNNTAVYSGGGVYNSESNMVNSTIVRNIANHGSGIYNSYGGDLTNSIVWGNGTNFDNNIVGDINCTYSAVEGVRSGENNILLNAHLLQNPLFVNPTSASGASCSAANADWHLQQGSICVNKGNNAIVTEDHDLDGTARIKRDTVDLGCYESDYYGIPSSDMQFCLLELQIGANTYMENVANPSWLEIYAGDEVLPFYTFSQTRCSYDSRKETILVLQDDSLRIVWHDPDPVNHYGWFKLYDPSSQRMVAFKNSGVNIADGEIATYVSDCGSTCKEEDKCPLHISLTRTLNSSNYSYYVNVMVDNFLFANLSINPYSSRLDTTLWFCPDRRVEVMTGQGGDDFTCTVTDAFGREESGSGWPSYGNSNVCQQQCKIILNIGSRNYLEEVNDPWLEIYAGDEDSPFYSFNRSWSNGGQIIPVSVPANVPLRFVWHEPDTLNYSSWCTIYGPSGNILVEKQAYTMANNNNLLTYTTTCGNDSINGIVYVKQNGSGSGASWEDARSSIQDAVLLALTHNADVWVAAGTYYGDTMAPNAFTMMEGVNVYGGFEGNEPADYDLSLRDFEANASVLDGLHARRVLYQANSFNSNTTWDGFTIQNGYTTSSGGGAYLTNRGKLSHCIIRNNRAYNGGGVYAYSSATVSNCLIANNTASNYGGGVYNYYSTIINATVVRNTANIGSGIYGSSGGTLKNSIVWGNGSSLVNNVSGNITCSYSAVEGGISGEYNILLSENIQQEPLFVHPTQASGASDTIPNGDWHLQQGSVCINRGNNAVVTGIVDLDGVARIKRDTVDMGCYETDFYSSPVFTPNYTNIIYVTQNGAGTQTGENWENATSSISFALAVARTFNADVWVASGIYYGDTTAESAFIMVEGVNVYGGFSGNEPADYNLLQRDFETNTTVLDGRNARRVLYQPSSFNTLTTWDGFAIQNGQTTGYGGGAYLNNEGKLSRCVIRNNIAYNGGGVYAYYGVVSNCLISNNTASYGGGVYAYYYSCVSNCLISNNTATSSGGGVYDYYATITNSTIVRNMAYNGAGIYGGNQGNLTNSIVWGNGTNEFNNITGSITCSYSAIEGGFAGVQNIMLSDFFQQTPQFVHPSLISGASDTTSNVDWHLQQGSICINRGNNSFVIDSIDLDGVARVRRDTVDMGCYESDFYSSPTVDLNYSSIIYVTQNGSGAQTGENWENATSSISFALAVARTFNADVWVATGIYYGDTTAYYAFSVGDSVGIYGGFAGNEPADYDLSLRDFDANTTILDGQHAQSVLSIGVQSVCDGFTIQNGKSSGSGGGVYMGSSLLTNCKITHNEAPNGWGGGVLCTGGTVSNCILEYNDCGRSGGGVYCYNKTSVSGCEVLNNTAGWGGGIYAHGQSSVEKCNIINNVSRNYGGGVGVYEASHISNSVVSHNRSERFGGGIWVSDATVWNCLVSNNTDSVGGGITVYDNGVIVSTTIAKNLSTSEGAGVYCFNIADVTLINSIVFGNVSNGISSNLFGDISCSYSAIEGGYSGDSIITLDAENPPLFVNPSLTVGAGDSTANVDWHLQQGSSCINRGLNSAVTDSLDLDGTARIKRDTVDMGCYESDYYSAPPTGYDSIIYVTVTGAGMHSGKSWSNATSSIEEAQALAITHNAVVWVAAGTYYGDTTSSNAFTMVEGVNVYGGFAGNEPANYDLSQRDFVANETVLDGDSARRVLYQSANFNTETKWNGFTIRNGQISGNGAGAYLLKKAALSQCKIQNNTSTNGSGGGVYVSNGRLTDCDVVGNTCYNYGGGVYAYGSTILGCRIESNHTTYSGSYGGGGGMYAYSSSVTGCQIIGNTSSSYSYGGGVYASSGNNIVSCQIINNTAGGYGGGVYTNSSNNKIVSCRISRNQSSYSGGGIYLSGSYTPYTQVRNCLVDNNSVVSTSTSYGGGGIAGSGTVVNTTIVRNTAKGDGAGVNGSTSTTLQNCIVWGNERNGVVNNLNGSSIVCNHCAIEDGYAGEGTVLLDRTCLPLFVNPSIMAGISDSTVNVDWHLQNGSVCVNRGDNSFVSDSLDMDGSVRIKHDTVDVGCYESDYYSVPVTLYDSIIYVTVTGAGAHSGNSWANATSSIEEAQALAITHNAVVWVAAGIYYGDTTSGRAFTMRDGVNVYGGFAGNEPAGYDLSLRDFETNATILDGMNARQVLYQPFEFSSQTEWNGFTIRNGRTSGSGAGAYLLKKAALSQCKIQNNTSTNGSGGGVYASYALVEECEIIGNTCRNSGGGVYATYSTVSDCGISGNSTMYGSSSYGGGGVYANYSTVTGCQIIGNTSTSYGGGVYASYSNKIFSCQIINNTSSSGSGGGVYVYSNGYNQTIDYCEISHNQSSYSGGGIQMSYTQVRNCLLDNNTAGTNTSTNYGGGGISGSGTVVNTTIVRNSSPGDGAGVNGSSSTTLTNCIVWGNERNGAANNINGSNVNCSYSAVEGGYPGTEMTLLDGTNLPLFANPSLTAGSSDSTANVDWHLQNGSVCINKGDNAAVTDSLDLDGTARIKRDTVDLGCYESDYYSVPITEYDSIIYVTVTGAGTHSGNSWANALSSIEEAQALAMTHNAVVWVAAGTYYGDTTAANAFTMRDGVNVYGGFAGIEPANFDLSQRDFQTNTTVLDGQNARRVLYQPFEFNNRTEWNGLTIQHGNTSGGGAGAYLQKNAVSSQCRIQDNVSTNGSGGGVYASYALVEECEIIGNTCRNSGGGVYSTNSTVLDCDISGNSTTYGSSSYGGGGVYASSSNVRGCRIIDNFSNSYGGGVYVNQSNTLARCEISGNISNRYGGGVYVYSSGYNQTIAHCEITHNRSSYSGGGIYLSSSCQVRNCLVANNTVTNTSSNYVGGGIYGSGMVLNTTIVRNSSPGDGAGVNGSSSTTLTNCIVWGNERNGAANNINGSNVNCSYSAVEGGYPGTEMTLLDGTNLPLFANPSLTAGSSDSTANVDWHLQNGSVCINKGDNAAVTDSLDLDGTARIKRDTVDLGCYESDYYSAPITVYDSIIYVTVTGAGTHSGNSWANATSSIEEAQALAQTYNAVVWVAAGTYYGDTTATNAFTMRDGVNVYGGFAGNEPAGYDLSLRDFETNATILDGQSARRVLYQPFDFNTETEWNGFVIRNGNTLEDGAGAYIRANSLVRYCVFRNNTTLASGGGVCVEIPVTNGYQSRIEQSVFTNNTAGNNGGAISLNTAYTWGETSVIRIFNCLISNNTAGRYGGGVNRLGSGRCRIYNTTIARNRSGSGGGGANESTLTNCIVWGNERNGAPDNVGGNLTCSHSAIEGGHEGDSIIVLNDINRPLFVNPSLTAGASDSTANVDWHLQQGSVCINRGDNSVVTDSLDLDGTDRIKRDTVDLGCYESDYYSVPVLYCTTVYGEFAATACDSYTWNDQVYSHSGDYQQTFPLANGCDSIVTLHLTVNHSVTNYEYLTVCASDLPYLYGDTLLDISTPQSLTISSQLLTQNGCDSTVILFLTVTPSTVGNFAAMTPTNNYPVSAYPIRFTWDAVENASNYDLYVWPVGELQPQQPTASHIHGTSYSLSSLANRGAYQWFMTAYNACDTSVSTARQFTLNVTPTLTVNTNNPVDMGEVQLNGARSIWFQVNGIALDSVISYQLTGSDSAAFALVPTAAWDSLRGGRMQLAFHPTAAQAEYTAQMTFYSDALVRTFTIKGYLADYLTFTTYVDTNIYAMDSEIPIHGRVTNPLNEPVAGLEVEVYVNVMDYVRTFPAISDANGQFTVMFTPQHSEAGYYTVGSRRAGGNSTAVHDDFNIPGMMLASSDWILWEPTIDQPDTGVIAVRNRSQIPLTNIQVTPVSLPNGCTVQFVPLNLAGLSTGELQYTVRGTQVSTGSNYEEARLNAICEEGAAMDFTAWYYCLPQRADLDVTPTSLTTTMTKGNSKVVDFKIYNNGTGPTGNIFVSLPDVPWMSVVGSDTLPSLAVHDSAYVSIRLSADSTTALVRYTGNLVINCERGEGVSIPYSITAISDSTGTLLVDVTDEYTWNTNGGHGPHLAGANVTVKGYYSLETVATGVTDANGHFVVNDLPEGWYKLIVRADKHEEYQNNLYVTADDTNRQDIFIQFQAITYSWEVVPTDIQDEYTYELNAKFETHVPKPVIVLNMPEDIPELAVGESYTFNYVLTNHGLVAAFDVRLFVPENTNYSFSPLYDRLDSLPAQTSIVIPCVMSRPAPTRSANANRSNLSNRSGSGRGSCPQLLVTKAYSYYTCAGEHYPIWSYVIRNAGNIPCSFTPSVATPTPSLPSTPSSSGHGGAYGDIYLFPVITPLTVCECKDDTLRDTTYVTKADTFLFINGTDDYNYIVVYDTFVVVCTNIIICNTGEITYYCDTLDADEFYNGGSSGGSGGDNSGDNPGDNPGGDEDDNPTGTCEPQVSLLWGSGDSYFNQLLVNRDYEVKGVVADGTSIMIIQVRSECVFEQPVWILEYQGQSDSRYTGTILSERRTNDHLLEFVYKAPEEFPMNVHKEYKVNFVFGVAAGDSMYTKIVPISIIRPPVLMVHGLNGNDKCFDVLNNSLKNNYYNWQLQKVDYKSRSLESFQTNLNVVQNNIRDCFTYVISNRYVVSKADVVGHSMGGILARLHVQYVNNNNIHKIITLNTPHSGSSGANLIMSNWLVGTIACGMFNDVGHYLGGLFGHCNLNAVNDLQVDSYAIRNYLNNPNVLYRMNGIPVHAISTTSIVTDENVDRIRNNEYVSVALAILKIAAMYDKRASLANDAISVGFDLAPCVITTFSHNLFGEQNDLVVSRTSQRGGLIGNCQTNFDGDFDYCHMESPDNPRVINKIKELLNKPVSDSVFCKTGFHPDMIHYPSTSETMSYVDCILSSEETHGYSDYRERRLINNRNSVMANQMDSSVQITASYDDYSRELSMICNHSNNIRHITIVSVLQSGEVLADMSDSLVANVPATYRGPVVIFAIGQTDEEDVVMDSTVIVVNDYGSTPQNISFVEDTLYLVEGETIYPSLECAWSNGDTTYVTPTYSSDSSIVSIQNGTITGNHAGTTLLTAHFEGLTASIPVVVYGWDIGGDNNGGSNGQDNGADSLTHNTLCASVTVQFSQTMTMTREAFEGTLTIDNGHESQPMQNIDVNFVIKDEGGTDCTNLFQINILSYNNMTGTNGNASLDAQNQGSIVVQFVPTKQAAPTMPKQYSFGGSFSFIDPFTGESMTYNLYPVDIMVNPSPDLYVNYFMQRDILGDDPLTEDRIEPIIPAELGVIIHNRGAGTAKNVLLETAEPEIIDNEKGLAIDFAMYGAALNGNERQLGLMEIPFGNIEPGRTGVGEWWFTSTLLGHFVSYEAHVIHNNSFGNPDLSLVSSLDIHPLIHTVYAYGNLDDGINDFLVDDVEDSRNYPDSLYFSNGSRTAVATADSIGFDHYVTPSDTIVILTLDPSRIGWNYGQTWDPGRGQYELISCTRNSDHQEIPLSNVWQSHVTLPVGADPIYENKLHIVDTLSNDLPTTYTLVFSGFAVTIAGNEAICDGENATLTASGASSYSWSTGDTTETVVVNPTATTTYMVTGTNSEGRSTTATFTLTVNHPTTEQIEATVFESFTWNGQTYTTSGDYTQTFTAANGCDSVVMLHLTIMDDSLIHLPELHVTSISHSDLRGGETATISWIVRNDGTAPTPNGAVWYDRVWLSVENRVAAGDNNPIFLGEFPNVSALAPGEYYTQTQSIDIPISLSGSYFLFVITDAYDAYQIYWDSIVPIPYDPPAYIGANSSHCSGADCGNYAGNIILELSEINGFPYYHDNFFYELVNIAIPALPDLKVTTVFPISRNFFSGTPVDLSYTVTNDGNYDTRVSNWQDVIFVSNHDEFDANARVLKTIPHNGLLLPDSSYSTTTTVTVPSEMYGTAYFYVYTDYYDQVYEHVGRYNNVSRSDSVNIILSPPADLVPRNILADQTVSTGATFNFSYEVHNQGAGEPNHSSWRDRCYLSADSNSITNAVQIADDWHYNGLNAGGSYAVQHSIAFPSHLTQGTYYLFVQADAQNEVFEYTMEDNNLARFVQPVVVLKPDLQIPTLNVADILHAGAEASVSYRLANTGDGAVVNCDVKDGFYLSQSPDGSNATQLPQFTSNTWLNAHDSTLKYQNVMLPSDLQDGTYYLFARTNIDNALNEANVDNNRSPIRQVYVNHQQLPDLVITSVTVPDTLTAGASATFTATIFNQGEQTATLNNLSFQLSSAATPNDIQSTTESVSTGSPSLAVGESTTVTMTIRISPAVNNPAPFTLTVNPNHTVSESSYSNNGYAFAHNVQPYPFDLAVTDLDAPGQIVSGEYINVEWAVQNQGLVPTHSLPMFMLVNLQVVSFRSSNMSQPWHDHIYLSSDTLLDSNDVQIGSYARNHTLLAGDSYTANLNCRIPVASDGNYYVLVVSDATHVTFDSQRANNVMARPIAVTQSALPDLQMDSLMAPNLLATSETCQIRYTVSNRGEHATHDNQWTDALYLNNTPSLQNAILLGSGIHDGQLDTNSSYTGLIDVSIPNAWEGACYLIGYTDATDQIYEMNNIDNNLFILPVSVTRPLPCDLTVLPPDFPPSVNVGEDVQISWTLRNVGLNTAQGQIKEAVYLSVDSIWSSDDIMLGSETYAVNLNANAQVQRSATLSLQGVPVGDYYVVVRSNILNALNENSYANNKAVSLLTMRVDYQSLYINQEEHRQLNSGQSVYYKLVVGPEYEHQTLSCKLTAPAPNVSNGLYIAYSSAPSASNFDWSATMPYVQEQEILIPSLNQGTYYIMATGQTANNAVQSVTLLATIVDFEIISVTANSGANTGSVTTQIIGAKFDTIMDFRLANSNGYLPAEKVFFHNSTETYATFNLRDQETGVYDMVAELPGGIITVKGQAFVVEQGLPAELLSNIIAPASVRSGNTFTVTIEYGNNGSADLNISGFLLVSTNGFPIAFSSDSLANNATELTFETGEPNGNPDVIRPGYFATKTIFVKANRVGNINLKLYPIRRQY